MSDSFVWHPGPKELHESFAAKLCQKLGFKTFSELFKWSVSNREQYWKTAVGDLGIRFEIPPLQFVKFDAKTAQSEYLLGAKLNIVESCFLGDPKATALIEGNEDGSLRLISFSELKEQSQNVGKAWQALGLKPGDAVAIDMPMTLEAVVAYLGCLWAGVRVVSIADSFAPDEISTRLRLGKARFCLTQDCIRRGGKTLPMLEKVQQASEVPAIVISTGSGAKLRSQDVDWQNFLAKGSGKTLNIFYGSGLETINILFSSGTTGDPKAIPWNQATPLKCAADARYHHNVSASDLLCWPTNLGWMMGPWLLFAAFLNRAGVAIFTGSPVDAAFAKFVSDQKVHLLGVVPSLVKSWRQNKAFEGLDLTSLKVFSSTGECSNPDDMRYLMSLNNFKSPVIEYCGGTEIGGAYVTSNVMEPNQPSAFSTPTLGLDFVILDEDGKATDNGEVFIVPPSIGLSTELLNRDHFESYFKDTPTLPTGERLRRHGDQLIRLENGYYQALGRTDDTMNLGGIKISSAEIERVAVSSGLIAECAAIAVPPLGGGPSLLVLYVVLGVGAAPDVRLQASLQQVLRDKLNPLFKIQELCVAQALPRTASNKVMRRVLRDQYLKERKPST